MKTFLKFIAFLFVVLFVVSAVTAVLFSTFSNVITSRDAMKRVVAEVDDLLVKSAPLLIAQSINEQARQQGLPEVPLDAQQLEAAIKTLLPPGWIEQQSETAVDVLYDALETGDIENAQLSIQTEPLRQQLEGEAGVQFVNTIIAGFPACEVGAPLPDIQNGEIPACIPAGLNSEQMVEEVHQQVVTAVNNNPQFLGEDGIVTIPLFPVGSIDEQNEIQAQFAQLQQNFQLLKQWSWTIWLIPMGCLFFILLFAIRSWGELGRWWGWPLVCAALATFMLTFAFPELSVLGLGLIDTQANAEIMMLVAQNIVQTLQIVWLSRVYVQAGIMLGLGTVLVFLTVLSRPGKPL